MGPLEGLKVVEFAGIGPGPFCAMMLSDMGADVIRLERKDASPRFREAKFDVLNRGRASAGIDLKHPEGKTAALKLIETADALLEGFRPDVMERLGLGPDICLERNPKLVYGRMTGWGQTGPLSRAAGHDINYISVSGALHAFGRKGERPVPPLNLVGDFGGGGMLLAFGMVCALLAARESGVGQVVDASMVDGSALLMASTFGEMASGAWQDERGVNRLDTGAHFYDAYETADGKFISIGSIEPQFFALMLEKADITGPEYHSQWDRGKWPELKKKLEEVFKTKTRDEWCEIMLCTDVCFAPVLSMEEAVEFPHNVERKTFIEIDGVPQPAPAPRFSRTTPDVRCPPPAPGGNTEEALEAWGFTSEEIVKLRSLKVI